VRQVNIVVLFCLLLAFSSPVALANDASNQAGIVAFVDKVAVPSVTDYHVLLPKKIDQYNNTVDSKDKILLARGLVLWHLMIDDHEGTLTYANELQRLANAYGDQVHLAVARLYIGYLANPEMADAVDFVSQWSNSLNASMAQHPRIKVHADLVLTYTKLRAQIFPFELQYLIQHLATIGDDSSFIQEKHIMLWSLVARGWHVEQTMEYLDEFLAHANKYEFPIHKYIILYNIAILLSNSEYTDASVYLAQAYVNLAEQQNHKEELFYGYERLGAALSRGKQYDKANIAFDNAYRFEEFGDPEWIAQTNLIQAENYFFLGDISKGKVLLESAESFLKAEDENYRVNKNYINRVLAKLALLEGNSDDALGYYEAYILNNRNDVYQRRIDDIQGVRSSMQRLIEQAKNSQALAERRLTQFQYASFVLVLVCLVIVVMAIRQKTVSSQLKSKTIELKKISRQDSLTQLFNRGHWELQAQLQIAQHKRYANHVATLAMFDIDNFKAINDDYGHVAGDTVIKFVADTVRQEIREVDVAGRYGGEEFAVLFPQTSVQEALQVTERIRKTLEKAVIEFDHQKITFTASFGLASLEACHTSAKVWVKDADTALYQSKENGKNQCTIYSMDGV